MYLGNQLFVHIKFILLNTQKHGLRRVEGNIHKYILRYHWQNLFDHSLCLLRSLCFLSQHRKDASQNNKLTIKVPLIAAIDTLFSPHIFI